MSKPSYVVYPAKIANHKIRVMKKEIERLNNKVEELMTLYTTERNVKEDYKAIIKEAIKHLHKRNEQNNSALTNKEETIISKHELLELEIINNKILEDILQGSDEE